MPFLSHRRCRAGLRLHNPNLEFMLVFGCQRLGSGCVFLRAMDFVFDRQKGVLQAAFDQGDGEVRNVRRSSAAPSSAQQICRRVERARHRVRLTRRCETA